jgi:hypothetical protein
LGKRSAQSAQAVPWAPTVGSAHPGWQIPRGVSVTNIQSNVAIGSSADSSSTDRTRKSMIGPTIFWGRTIDQRHRAYTKTPKNTRQLCAAHCCQAITRCPATALLRYLTPPPPPAPPLPRPAHMHQCVHDARCQLRLVYSRTISSSTLPDTALIRRDSSSATVLGLESLTIKHSATFASSVTLLEPSLRLAPVVPLPAWVPAWRFCLTLGYS